MELVVYQNSLSKVLIFNLASFHYILLKKIQLKDSVISNTFEEIDMNLFENHSTTIVSNMTKEHISTKETELLGPFFQQEASIKQDIILILKYESTDMRFSCRLNNKYLVYHSLQYRKNYEKKSCSYIVRFHETKQSFCYLNYFFEFNKQLYACIYQIYTKENTFIENSLMISNYENTFFLITSIDQNYKIILCSEIVNKCIKVKVNETVSFITDFISENEHD